MIKLLCIVGLLLTNLAICQLPPKQPYDFDVKQIHSGHSLTDPLFHPWPGQYRYLVSDVLGGPWDNIGKSTIPGSPMKWRWNNSSQVSPDARLDIANWELLCITEGVPLFIDSPDMQSWEREGLEEQREYMSLFTNNAWNYGNNGNGAATMLWTTWTNIDDSDGPWRQLLDTYETEWENIQDFANDSLPNGATPVYLIPGHRMMARLYDDIENDLVPGIDSLPQFFEDNIHVNYLGAYAVAMIHYACIFNESPVGLSNNLYSDPNNNEHPSQALATYLQHMIWEVVLDYSERTGIVDEIMSVGEISRDDMVLVPNPVESTLRVGPLKAGQLVRISNMAGQLVLESKTAVIDLSRLKAGLYVVDIGGVRSKIRKI